MQAATTSAVALGRIALAALLDTSPSARDRGGPDSDHKLPTGSRLPALVASGVTAAGWLIERNKLQNRGLDKDARSAVRMKDFLFTGSALTSLAALAGEQALSDRHRRYEKLAASVSRAFTVAAVGATPFINFALFEDYRPHPARRFVSL